MERKLGISVVGGASYEYATAKEPVHYQAPLPAAIPQPQPLPAPYYAPPPVMFSVPPPVPVPVPVPAPAHISTPALIPAQAAIPAPTLITAPVQASVPVPKSAAAQLAPGDVTAAEQLLAMGPLPDFKFHRQPEDPVPEAPPPPQISGENMSLTSFLEATVKAIAGPPSPTGRIKRCKAATAAYLAGEILPKVKFGRLVIDTAVDLRRYTSKTHFDHPAQETLMKLKSPLLRMSDIRLAFTEREAAKPLSGSESSSSDELEDVDSNDDIAIIAEVPKNKVIDTLDLDPVGDSSDAADEAPCSECARRSAVVCRDVAVNTAARVTTHDVSTQASMPGNVALDDVSEESEGEVRSVEGERTQVLRSQYEQFRRSIGAVPQGGAQKGGGPMGQNKTGGPMGGQQKTGGPMGSQQKTGGPMGGQQKTGGPIGGQQKTGGPMGGQQKTGGPMGSQQKTGGPMGGQLKTGGPMGSQQKTGGPMVSQPLIGNLLAIPGTQLAGLSASGGPMAGRQDSDWRSPGPRTLSEQEAGQPLFQRRDAMVKPFALQTSFAEHPGSKSAAESNAAKLQPLGGNSSFPRDLLDAPFANRYQPSPWVQPFQDIQQFQSGRPFQGAQPRPWDSANGGTRSTGLLGAAPGLAFGGSATPFLQGGSFVAQTGRGQNATSIFGGQQNTGNVFGGNQNPGGGQQNSSNAFGGNVQNSGSIFGGKQKSNFFPGGGFKK